MSQEGYRGRFAGAYCPIFYARPESNYDYTSLQASVFQPHAIGKTYMLQKNERFVVARKGHPNFLEANINKL